MTGLLESRLPSSPLAPLICFAAGSASCAPFRALFHHQLHRAHLSSAHLSSVSLSSATSPPAAAPRWLLVYSGKYPLAFEREWSHGSLAASLRVIRLLPPASPTATVAAARETLTREQQERALANWAKEHQAEVSRPRLVFRLVLSFLRSRSLSH
jgi:hypothetical protein